MSPKSNEEHAARRLQSFDTERYDDGFDTEPPDGVLTELGAPPKRARILYGEYDYANSDKLRIPWAVDAGFRWAW
jgi:hypothetical protein